MAKAHVKQNMGGAAAAVEAYRNSPTPNVIVIEATADRDFLVTQLDELSEYCDAGTKVIIIGKVNDIILYRQLIARGVSEYLVLPFGVVDFVSAVSQLFKTPGAKPLGPFYELETSSPALRLQAGEQATHLHRTFHLVGPEAELDALARATLKVGLRDITTAFHR